MADQPPHQPPSGPPPSGPPPSGPPPSGPPPSGPPPSGPPPSGPPPSGPPPGYPAEMLDSRGGAALPPGQPRSATRGRRTALIAGGAVAGLAAFAAAGVVGFQVYFASGPQAAEALPDSTVVYVSVDLDPSGKQKLAALDTLEKFPAFADDLDIDSRDDLRAKALETIQDLGACGEVNFDEDVAPWLGDRIGVAAVDLGDDTPAPVGVIQISGADAAQEGLEQLRECGGGPDAFGWSIQGGWAVVAATDEEAERVTDAASESSLSDDDSYQRWTEAAGDPGIISAYVSPRVGDLAIGGLLSSGGTSCYSTNGEDAGVETDCEDGELDQLVPPEAEAAIDALRDFEGGALTVRFADGGLEVEAATSGLDDVELLAGTEAGQQLVEGLPEQTGFAIGAGFADGWATDALDLAESYVPADELDSFLASAQLYAGLELPDDAETLVGDAAAVAIDGDVDPATLEEDGTGVGALGEGDPDAVESVLDRVRSTIESSEPGGDTAALESDSDGSRIAVGPDAAWREALLADGDLGQSDAYRDVLGGVDESAGVVYVDFDADVVAGSLADGDREVEANIDPLRAAGLAFWTDGDESHLRLRISTD